MKKLVTCTAVLGLLAGSSVLGWGSEFEESALQETGVVHGAMTHAPRV